MRELTILEIGLVGGSIRNGDPSLSRPTRGESELGRQINDIAGMLNDFGGRLGRSFYDWTH
jgi:hypothetical protein